MAGRIANPLYFPTIPTAADALTPILLAMVVSTKNEKLIMTFWIEMGMPTFIIIVKRSFMNLNERSLKSKTKSLLIKVIMHRIMLIACEMTVAMAAPFAAMPNAPTSNRSNATLIVHAMDTKIKGLLLSPKALRMAENALYPKIKTVPSRVTSR